VDCSLIADVGHWDGDTLVVETTGFRDDVWLGVEGSPLTSSGKMTERRRRVKFWVRCISRKT
jgi:hypothetical protein